MLKIFTDAAFDPKTRLGSYCLVTIYKNKKDYCVENVEDCKNSTDVELQGLRAALELAKKAGVATHIYCDNMGAIDRIAYEWSNNIVDFVPGVIVKHFKGHQLGSEGVIVDDDVKAHSWCDMMAGRELERLLAFRKTEAYDN